MGVVDDLRGSRELLANLTQREIKGKYKRTALGQLWSLANPIATMLIYTAVFSIILRVPPGVGDPSGLEVFALFLMCGLLPWNFFSSVVTGGMNSLTGNENLIKKVSFPRVALVISQAASSAYNWLWEMGVLVIAIFLVGTITLPGINRVFLFVPGAIIMMVLLAIFALGVAMMLSVANVYFRDTQYLVGIVFQIWFYLTPILYPIEMVSSLELMTADRVAGVSLLDLYLLNPMAEYIEAFRALLYDNRLPDLSNVLMCVAWAAVAFFVGYRIFTKHEKGLAEAL